MRRIVTPVLVTNAWQATRGGALGHHFRRFWSLNLLSCAGVWGGTVLLFMIDPRVLSIVLGGVIIAYVLVNLFAVRLSVPALSQERRQQLAGQVKRMGEEQKIVLRNARRDANKHADALAKQDGQHFSEDEIKTLHTEIQDLVKKYEKKIDGSIAAKTTEVLEI